MCTKAITVTGSYDLPRKNVLVLGCIDLRFTDEIMNFLSHDNLTNRFDYFTLAGASLTTQYHKYNSDFKSGLPPFSFNDWSQAFLDHVAVAIALHHIQDVYIVEHRDCGAYEKWLKNGAYTNSDQELADHKKYATALAKELQKISIGSQTAGSLNVHAFLIDLRGDVELLYTTKNSPSTSKKPPRKK